MDSFFPLITLHTVFHNDKAKTDFFRVFCKCMVSLRSLSCWNVNLSPSPRSWALWKRFSLRISLYFSAFIFPSILTSLPVPVADKHPHSTMLPPPCLTVGMVSKTWCTVPGFFHTRHWELWPSNSILILSDQWTLLLMRVVQVLFGSQRAVMCILVRNSFRMAIKINCIHLLKTSLKHKKMWKTWKDLKTFRMHFK